MTSKNGPTGEEKKALKLLKSLNRILGTHRESRSGYDQIQVRTGNQGYGQDNYDSLVRWERTWGKPAVIACGFGIGRVSGSQTSYLREPFHKAWKGLSQEERAELLSLSKRAYAFAQSAQNDEIRFRVMGSKKVDERFLTKFEISSDHKLEDLLLFLPTWSYVAPALRKKGYKVRKIDKNKIVEHWERAWTESGWTAFGGDRPSDTYHEEVLDFFEPVVSAEEDHFLIRVGSAKEAKEGILKFRKRIGEYFVPKGVPIRPRIESYLGMGYEISDKKEERGKQETESRKKSKEVKKLEGEEI